VAGTRTLYGPDNLRAADALLQHAIALRSTGDLAGAEAAVREGLATSRRLLPPESPQVASAVSSLATVLLAREDLDGAEAGYAEAFPLLVASLGPGHSETVFAANRLGMLRLRRGALEECERDLRGALAAARAELTPGTRYEWMAHVTASLLGEAIYRRAAGADRDALFAEAEALITPAADTLVTLADKMGRITRADNVAPALDRAVALYEAWNAASPTPERQAALAAWRGKRDAFKAR